VLDNDVDAGVVRVFVKAGHVCWRGAEAGVTTEDDDLSVYAENQEAVVVTHDREFTERRKRNTFGKHVRLKCLQPDACDVLKARMDELVALLNQHDELVIEVTSSQLKLFRRTWR
jgi:predicted nuclease of predicted toxin-antitoxin system